jgi:endoglucanase
VRSFPLPLERLRRRVVFLGAEVKATNISAKPNPWNGVKVMVRIDTPTGSQWPQAELPAGSFEWQRCSRRFLVPPDATAVTLVLGLEAVSGQAWFHDVHLTLAKELVDAPAAAANAPIFRGHSLPRLRGAMVAPDALKESDLGVLAREWGGNLIRWQLVRSGVPANETGFSNYDRWLDQQLSQLDRGLTWAASMGVKVVVDLHSPPGGRSISGGYQAAVGSIWTDTNAQTKFIEVWRKIATRYRGDQRIWGYDLVNEPVDENVAEGCDDWQTLALRAGQMVRSIDPQRTLIVEPPNWGSASGFIGFQPLALSNVVYSFHIYDPHAFTHQGVFSPSPPRTYPGQINGAWWDKSAIEGTIKPAMAFAARYRVHMYVGEFSVIRWAPGGGKYLSDLIEILENHGWDWSYHAFREWDGWSVEHGADKNDHAPTAVPSARKEVLLKWMGKNKLAEKPHGADDDSK